MKAALCVRSEGDGRRVAAAEPGQRGASGRPREAEPEPRDGVLLHHGVGTGKPPHRGIGYKLSFLFYYQLSKIQAGSVILHESWRSGYISLFRAS